MLSSVKSRFLSIKLSDIRLSEKISGVKKPKSISFFMALTMNYFVGPLVTTFSMPVLIGPFVLLFLALFGQSIPVNFQNTEEIMRNIFSALMSDDVSGGMKKIIGDIDKSSMVDSLKMFSMNNIYLALTATGAVLFFLFAQNIYRYTKMIENIQEKKYTQAFRELSVSFAPLLTVGFFYWGFVGILTAMKGIIIMLIMFFASPIGLLGGQIGTVLRFAVVISAGFYLWLMFVWYKKVIFPLLYNFLDILFDTFYVITKHFKTALTVAYRIILFFMPLLIGVIVFGVIFEVIIISLFVNAVWAIISGAFYSDSDVDSKITSSYVYTGLDYIYKKMDKYKREKLSAEYVKGQNLKIDRK